jgi:molybdate transport system permease protein
VNPAGSRLRLVAASSVAIGFLAIPVVVLVGRSLLSGSVLGAVATPAVGDALLLSVATTGLSLALVVVVGSPLAVLLARSRSRSAAWLETAVDLPIVLPPSVAGLALLLVFGSRGLVGTPLAEAGLAIPFTTLAVVLAQTFVAAPFFIRSARAGIVAVDHELEDAARVDGAAERHVFRWITVPLAAPALAAGLVMTWARALGEFGATIMFAGNIAGRTQTLPLVVYGEFQSGDLDASIAAATVLVVAAFIALVAVRVLGWAHALDARAGA